MNLLIIRFSSIGDIVLTTPVIRCVKKQLPEAQIHYLTKEAFASVLSANPYIDKLHFFKQDLSEAIPVLKGISWDAIIDLHHNVRSLRVKKALRAPAYSFSKLNVKKWLLVQFKINLMPRESIVSRYLKTLEPLGIESDRQGLDYFVPDHIQLKNEDIPMSHWAGYVACVIGGSYETKRFPVKKWRELIKRLPFPVMLLGGSEDRQRGEIIAHDAPIKIYNACGKFSLNESALLIQNAKVVVSNDTGLMHIAAAFRKPVISLWGNTTPAFGMAPYFGNDGQSPPSLMMENKELYCHPCSKLGYNRCPERHFRCMNALDTTLIAEKVSAFWPESVE